MNLIVAASPEKPVWGYDVSGDLPKQEFDLCDVPQGPLQYF